MIITTDMNNLILLISFSETLQAIFSISFILLHAG